MRRWLIVIKARFLISMKMYFRYPINVIMTLFEPLMWITPFYFMGKTFSQDGNMTGFQKYTGNSDFVGFLVLGYMITSYVSTVFWSMGFSLREEMTQGVLESNWSAPVNRTTLLVSKSLFQFCATTFEVILTGIVCHFAFGFTITSNLLKAIGFLIPSLIGMIGIGMAVSALVLLAKDANPIIDLSNSIVAGLSGSFFPIKVMPKGLMFISLALPLTYIYDSSRALLINQEPLFSLKTEFLIIVASMFIFTILGSYVFSKVERRCRMLGNLGTH
ncbi:ABC transporter permease [Fervidicella metallireducens AeB]|uniref:Transport permease protein n=1 Tax=Fervidicella metallireducens AeB TaxID=1403537 RepID=A0A017RRJ7_9CLOT|nr:ABC transporter permease [Fervidicella metallireducens]EYE87393.1 ABC transporter permease [Fervidicella metallireducens AeB]